MISNPFAPNLLKRSALAFQTLVGVVLFLATPTAFSSQVGPLQFSRCADLFNKMALSKENSSIYIGDGFFGLLNSATKTVSLPNGKIVLLSNLRLPLSETSGLPIFKVNGLEIEPYYKIKIGDKFGYQNEVDYSTREGVVTAILSDSYVLLTLEESGRVVRVKAGGLLGPHGFLHNDLLVAMPLNIPITKRDYISAQRRQNYLFEQARSYEMRWNIDGDQAGLASHETYDSYFWHALGSRRVVDYLIERKQNGYGTHVLDLFGSALFTTELGSVDSLTGARLQKVGFNRLPPGYTNQKWDEVDGDFMLKSSWKKLRENMQTRGISRFDLIIFRPVGANGIFDNNENHPNSMVLSIRKLFRMFKQGYNVLTSQNGCILISVELYGLGFPEESSPAREFYKFLDRNKINYEIVMDSHKDGSGYSPVIKIIKTDKSPVSL